MKLLQKPSMGAGPPIAPIFQYAKEEFRNIHARLAILKSWSATDAVFLILISKTPNPQLDKAPVGTLPESAFCIWDEMWDNGKEKSGFNFCSEPFGEKQYGA